MVFGVSSMLEHLVKARTGGPNDSGKTLGIMDKMKGKLPAKTLKERYELEYGTDCLEIHADAIKKGEKVVLLDDLLATGGTAKAAEKLLTRCGGEVVGAGFLIELSALKGRELFRNTDIEVFSVFEFKD